MSRENASGWLAFGLLVAVFGAGAVIRQTSPAANRPVGQLAAVAAPPTASPVAPPVVAVTPADRADVPASAPMAVAEPRHTTAPARRPAPRRVAAPLQAGDSVTSDIAPAAITEQPGAAPIAATATPAAGIDPVASPLPAHHLDGLGLVPGTNAVTHAQSGAAEGPDAAARESPSSPVKRVFDTAGRGIAGGVRTAGAAIRHVF